MKLAGMKEISFKRLFLLLQIAVVAVFLGRAWQHLYWDAPYRVLLWDEDWMKPIIEGIFGISWEDYVTNLNIDKGIQQFIRIAGGFYVLCAFAAIFIQKFKKISIVLLWIGAGSLAFLAFLYAKDRFFQIPQFLEYALQWSAPVFLIAFYKNETLTPKLVFWMKIATTLTFICHGMYAIGMGNVQQAMEFTQMTISILHIDEHNAILFLRIAGLLDFLVGVLIFLPGRTGRIALIYCIVWGFLTTIARVWANFYPAQFPTFLLQTLHESLYRFPHFMIPMILFLYLKRSDRFLKPVTS